MDFMIRYHGPLPSNGTSQEKQQIREAIHPQLEVLCAEQPLLEQARHDQLPEGVLKGGRVEVPRPLEMLFFAVHIGGFQFVPLIHRPHELACSLDTLFLRREKPGAVVQVVIWTTASRRSWTHCGFRTMRRNLAARSPQPHTSACTACWRTTH